MYEYYTINHIALITGLTSRTIRNHMKQGLLEGEMINGVWHFTAEQVCAFMSHPAVAPSIRAPEKCPDIRFSQRREEKKQRNVLHV